MNRRVLGISVETWTILVAGFFMAIWFLLVIAGTAHANDCINYIKNPSNFIEVPKGLIEDCMRTGMVQAAATAAAATAGGAAILAAINKALKDAGQAPVVPGKPVDNTNAGIAVGGTVTAGTDGETTGSEGEGDPSKPPESPGNQQTRDGTPEACQSIWDEMQKKIAEAKDTEYLIELCQKHLQKAIDNKQNNLTKVTIQLGIDATDMATAGAGGVRGAMGIAKALTAAPELLEAIANAVRRSEGLAEALENIARDLAQISGNVGRYANNAREAGRLSAQAEARVADLVREAAAVEGNLANYEELVRFAKSADATLLERNSLMKTATTAEEALEAANQEHQKIIDRKKSLDDWATAERASIKNEDARAFANRHEELSNARAKMEKMRAEHAARAKQAHADWQAKMNELSAAKKELDEARAMTAHLQQARQELVLAEQDARTAATIEDGAVSQLDRIEGELKAFDQAAHELEELQTVIRDLEREESDLVTRLETLDRAIEAHQAFEIAEEARDAAAAAVDACDAEIRKLEDELKNVGKSDYLDHLIAEEREAFEPYNKFQQEQVGYKQAYDGAQIAEGRVDTKVDAARRARGEDAVFTPAELAEMEDARQYTVRCSREYSEAKHRTDLAHANYSPKEAALAAERERIAPMVHAETERIKPLIADQQAKKPGLAAKLREAEANYDAAAKKFQPYDHAGIDLKSRAKLEDDLSAMRRDINDKKHDAASRHTDVRRSDIEENVAEAKVDVEHAKDARQKADKAVEQKREALKAADTTGTGEDAGNLHYLESAQAKYNDLLAEQERLRVQYEQMASGSFDNPAEAAAIKTRMDEIEGELANWKEPDFDTEAAKRYPDKYEQWQANKAGPPDLPAVEAKITSLTSEIANLKTDLATVERKLADQQAQAGNRSTGDLEAERDRIKNQLSSKEGEVTAAKGEAQARNNERSAAEKQQEDEEKKQRDTEAKQAQTRTEKQQADEEVRRLQYQRDHPGGRPDDVTGAVNWVPGGDWTPYKGSGYESVANKSHQLREAYDDIMGNFMKYTQPGVYYTYQGGKKVLSLAGQLFHAAFGGQSPEEIAAILKRDVELVEKYSTRLAELQDQYKKQIGDAKDLQRDLELCKARNS